MYVLVIYSLLGLAVLCSVLFEEKRNKKAEWVIYTIIALFFLIRFSVGQDTGAYAWLFSSVENPFAGALTSHMMRNFGYTFLNYLVKISFGEFRFFVLLSNIIILSLCTYTVYKESHNCLLSMMLFVGSGMLEVYYGSGMRQGIAMALYLFAFYKFLPEKKYLWYELFIFIALGFQEIAFVLIPIPLLFILIDKFKAHPYKLTIIISCATGAVSWFIYRYLIDLEYWITAKTGYEPVWTHLIAYFHRRSFSIAGLAMEVVFLLGIMIMYWLADKKEWNDFNHFEVLTFVYSCTLYFMMSGYSIMSRASDMIQIIILILIPRLIFSIPNKTHKVLSVLAIFALNSVLLYVDLYEKCRNISGKDNIQATILNFPYITVFDKETIDHLYED